MIIPKTPAEAAEPSVTRVLGNPASASCPRALMTSEASTVLAVVAPVASD